MQLREELLLQLLRRQWSGQKEALHFVAPAGAQPLELPFALDALGGHGEIEAGAE